MGRKAKSSKLEETAHKPESTDPSVGVELEPKSNCPYSQGVELEPKSNHPSSEGVNFQSESTNPTLEREELLPKMQANAAGVYSKKIKKNAILATVRRSPRLQHAIIATQDMDVERVISEITLSESEKEDDPFGTKLPEPTFSEKSLEEKVDYLAVLLEGQQKTIDELKSKATKQTFFNESYGVGDVTYKSLYIESQKKVEALMVENHELSKKLENALGKIEVFENRNHVVSEVLEKMKDVILFSGLMKATEAAANVSSEAMHDALNALRNDLCNNLHKGLEGEAGCKRKRKMLA